ncbi:MAG: hypothetical protein ACREMR_07670 [Gemmatimonadales bacterium]
MNPDGLVPILCQGQWEDAELVEPVLTREVWSEYVRPDGAVIRLKAVVTTLYRVPGQTTSAGLPLYVVHSQTCRSTSCTPRPCCR